MPDTSISLEADIDDAANRRDALQADAAIAREVIEGRLNVLACKYGCDAVDSSTRDKIDELVSDFLWDALTRIQNAKTDAENALGAIEDADLRSNSPVVL